MTRNQALLVARTACKVLLQHAQYVYVGSHQRHVMY